MKWLCLFMVLLVGCAHQSPLTKETDLDQASAELTLEAVALCSPIAVAPVAPFYGPTNLPAATYLPPYWVGPMADLLHGIERPLYSQDVPELRIGLPPRWMGLTLEPLPGFTQPFYSQDLIETTKPK